MSTPPNQGGGSTCAQGYLMMGGGICAQLEDLGRQMLPHTKLTPRVRPMNVNKGGISWLLFVTVSERNIL